MAVAFSRAARPRPSLQAKKTYQVYHTESMNAEAKLREAERQEEKRAGRSNTGAPAAATDAGPLRKSSLKKGGRLVEKVGLEGPCLSSKALVQGFVPGIPGPGWGLLGGGVWRENAGPGRGESQPSGKAGPRPLCCLQGLRTRDW